MQSSDIVVDARFCFSFLYNIGGTTFPSMIDFTLCNDRKVSNHRPLATHPQRHRIINPSATHFSQ